MCMCAYMREFLPHPPPASILSDIILFAAADAASTAYIVLLWPRSPLPACADSYLCPQLLPPPPSSACSTLVRLSLLSFCAERDFFLFFGYSSPEAAPVSPFTRHSPSSLRLPSSPSSVEKLLLRSCRRRLASSKALLVFSCRSCFSRRQHVFFAVAAVALRRQWGLCWFALLRMPRQVLAAGCLLQPSFGFFTDLAGFFPNLMNPSRAF